jgi:MoxR-like ATPase
MSQQAAEQPTLSFAHLFGAVVKNVERVLQGKTDVVQLALLCLLAEGHLLVEDVPGVGKTTLAKAMAQSIHCTASRVQFTPDLLPSDVVGVSVYNRATNAFEFRHGPIFANIVLGDEINRASPKTQSALLEAMAERQVTVDGNTYDLQAPFMVIATQNPSDHEGTYPLPESQLDRFLMRVSIGYPGREAELEMLEAHSADDAWKDLGPVVSGTDIQGMTAVARTVHVAPGIRHYLVNLAEASRHHPRLALGISPRAVLSLQRAARVRAAASGRAFVIPDDVKALALPVLAHRVAVTAEAQLAGAAAGDVLAEILALTPAPTVSTN